MEGAQERTKKELGTGRPGVERNGGGGGEKPKALFCVPPRSRRLDVGSEDRHGEKQQLGSYRCSRTLFGIQAGRIQTLIDQLVRMALLS